MAFSSYTFIWPVAEEIEFTFVIRGHHVYETEWSPMLGERLVCWKDEQNEAKKHDEHAVEMFIQESRKLVGHIPTELSLHVFTFVRAHGDNQVVVEVSGGRKLENALAILGTLRAPTRSLQIGAKFHEELTNVKRLCTHVVVSLREMRRKAV